MSYTVPVVSIFTAGSASGGTSQERQARQGNDISSSNLAWGSGFSPGVRCGMTFTALARYNTPTTIDSRSVTSLDDPRLIALFDMAKRQTNNATALYVIYVSGEFLTSSGNVIGIGGPRFKFYNSTTDYGLYGHIVMSDGALNSYGLAHEAGHCLFGRFLNSNQNSFTINDPSNPGSDHSNNPQNLMFPTIPNQNPEIVASQCSTARLSKIVSQNATNSRGKIIKNNLTTMKKLNARIIAKMRYMKKDTLRRRPAKAIKRRSKVR
jgi:hypothetical protein